MENMKDGGPAFPVHSDIYHGSGLCGMTLRDWFAGQALMGWAAGRNRPMDHEACEPASVARSCYDYADAMLRARERGQEADDNESWLWSQANARLHRLSDGSHTATIDGWAASGATRAEAIRALRAKVKRGVR